jgi:hypothetical protein
MPEDLPLWIGNECLFAFAGMKNAEVLRRQIIQDLATILSENSQRGTLPEPKNGSHQTSFRYHPNNPNIRHNANDLTAPVPLVFAREPKIDQPNVAYLEILRAVILTDGTMNEFLESPFC